MLQSKELPRVRCDLASKQQHKERKDLDIDIHRGVSAE